MSAPLHPTSLPADSSERVRLSRIGFGLTPRNRVLLEMCADELARNPDARIAVWSVGRRSGKSVFARELRRLQVVARERNPITRAWLEGADV